MGSLSIAGTEFNCIQWPKATIDRRIEWMTDEGGYRNGSDRGAAQDVYESEITIVGKDAEISSLHSVLNANSEAVTLSAFGAEVFAPNVNHTGSITATWKRIEPRKHKAFATVGSSVQEVTLSLRAISPTLLTPTASLASLLLQRGWTGDHSRGVRKTFSYSQAATYATKLDDVGFFQGQFLQTKAQTQAILAYLCTTGRANSFSLPTFPGTAYPFGIGRGAGPFNAKVERFEFTRVAVSRWMLDIEFLEAP